MKTQETDKELKSLIKEIKLDSPGNEFTSMVMNRVFEEKAALEKAKKDKVFGKGFWIILILFMIVFIAMIIFSISGIEVDSQLSTLLSSANQSQLSQGYQSIFNKIGTLPLSISGILFATSILLFIDKFLPRFMPHRSH